MEKVEYIKMFEFENHYWWYRGLHELIERAVRDIHTKRNNEPLHIFDAGCGTGRMLELLEKFGTVEGIDYSPDAVSFCNQRGLKNTAVGDLNDWTPPEDKYDIIISNDVICTTGVEDDRAVMEKFHKALKPGGYLLLNLPAFMALRRNHDIAVSGKRRYRKNKTVNVLKDIGFTVVTAGYRLPVLFFIILIQKFFTAVFPARGEVTSDLKPLPSPVNGFFLAMHRIENQLIHAGFPILFGSSLFLVSVKRN